MSTAAANQGLYRISTCFLGPTHPRRSPSRRASCCLAPRLPVSASSGGGVGRPDTALNRVLPRWRRRRTPAMDREDAALLACRLCVAAYERARLRGGSVDWDDIEAAYAA